MRTANSPPKYVLWHHRDGREIYLTGMNRHYIMHPRPTETNKVDGAKTFDSAREAYDYARPFRDLQGWRVGARKWAGLDHDWAEGLWAEDL